MKKHLGMACVLLWTGFLVWAAEPAGLWVLLGTAMGLLFAHFWRRSATRHRLLLRQALRQTEAEPGKQGT